MDFYSEVTEATALEWYNKCPAHLRKKVSAEQVTHKSGEEAVRADDEHLWMRVYSELGYHRPSKLPPEEHPGDGYSKLELEQYEKRKTWVRRYDELNLIQAVVKAAPGIQSERKMLMQAIGHSDGGNGFPQQSTMEGIDDVQAAAIRWIQATGITPLEALVETYRSDDPAVKVSDKIAAAAKLMDFVHKRVPVKTEVKTDSTTTPVVSPELFSKLSSKELTLLKELMRKMGEGQGE